jgi:glycosyltransferase involved in cell wall biosynthesis
MPARIIRVAQVVRPAEGGIRSHVSSLLAGLPSNAFAPTLFAPANLKLSTELNSISREEVAIEPRISPARDLAAILGLSARLRGRFDVVHAHGIRGALIGVAAAKLAGIPSVFTAHNILEPQGGLSGAVLRWLGRSATVVAVSHAVAESLRACGISVDDRHIISNGIDPAQFDTSALSEAERNELLESFTAKSGRSDEGAGRELTVGELDRPVFVVAGIGRLSHEKGFDVLISAFDVARGQAQRRQAGRQIQLLCQIGRIRRIRPIRPI